MILRPRQPPAVATTTQQGPPPPDPHSRKAWAGFSIPLRGDGRRRLSVGERLYLRELLLRDVEHCPRVLRDAALLGQPPAEASVPGRIWPAVLRPVHESAGARERFQRTRVRRVPHCRTGLTVAGRSYSHSVHSPRPGKRCQVPRCRRPARAVTRSRIPRDRPAVGRARSSRGAVVQAIDNVWNPTRF